MIVIIIAAGTIIVTNIALTAGITIVSAALNGITITV